MTIQRERTLLWGGLLVALLVAYSNHFENSFHFDDFHAVVNNEAIQRLSNIPKFFVDARTFGNDPRNQSYRPLVSTSLAFDYALGGGLDVFWFHLSNFIWFCVLVFIVYGLYTLVLQRAWPNGNNIWIAWYAAALYGLHPVCAETVNYIVQRGDLYVAVGMVGGISIYAWRPAWRQYGIYLIPALGAMLSKPTGVIFPMLLAAYVVLIERRSGTAIAHGKHAKSRQVCRCDKEPTNRKRAIASKSASDSIGNQTAGRSYGLHILAAVILTSAFLCLEKLLTPPTFFHSATPLFDYWITQPFVTLRYCRSFLIPLFLKIDTDLQAFHSMLNASVLAGFGFCLFLILAAILAARRREWRPVSFGLWWFLISLVPTAVYTLTEVENDHRMFLPFVGLAFAAVYAAAQVLRVGPDGPSTRVKLLALMILAVLGFGTYRRNEAWRTEESLWRDDIAKSPNNARGHYGVAYSLQKQPAQVSEAIAEYRAALRIKPDFAEARANLGSLLSDLPGRLPEAIAEYEAGLRITPDSAALHNNLGTALAAVPGHSMDAIAEYQTALRIDPDHAKAHINLGNLLSAMPGREQDAFAEFQAALRIDPNCAECRNNLGAALSKDPQKLAEAISNYREAIRIKPDFAEAHYNLAAALAQTPGHEQEEIAECEAALRFKPDLNQARNALEHIKAMVDTKTR